MIRNRSGALVAGCVFVTLLAACGGGSSSSANGDKTAFCKTNADINAQVGNVNSPDQLAAALKTVQGKLDSFLKSAPPEVRNDAQLLVTAAQKAISTNDVTPFQTDTNLQAAGTHVDSFCGTSSSSSSSTSSGQAASSSSSSAKSLKACEVFDLQGLNSATGLTWKVLDSSRNEACVIQADNGNTISMVLAPTSGQTDAILTGGKSACDSGTVQDQSIADGGFVCQVSGINTGGAVYAKDATFVSVSAITFNGATDADIQKAIVALLKSFVA